MSNGSKLWSEDGLQVKFNMISEFLDAWLPLLIILIICFGVYYFVVRVRSGGSQNPLGNGGLVVDQQISDLRNTKEIVIAQEGSSTLGILSSSAAHEINNPTNFVYGSCQNLEVDLKDFQRFLLDLAGEDADKEVLDELENRFSVLFNHLSVSIEGANRIKQIVRDLSVFSSIDNHRMERVSIGQCIQKTVALVSDEYAGFVDFNIHLDHEIKIACYPSMIQQLVINLLKNACQAIKLRYSNKKGKIIVINKVKDNCCIISINDNAGGISEQSISKIFSPLYTTKAIGSGTGLGLPLSFDIIQTHRGTLALKSKKGLGTTFIISLPIMDEF